VKAGDTVDTAEISAEAQRMSALQDFESVEYAHRRPAEPDAGMVAAGKGATGPTTSKFDLGVYGSEGGDLGFVVYAKHTRTWLNSLGAEWRNEVQLGYYNNLSTSSISRSTSRSGSSSSRAVLHPVLGRRVLRQRTARDLQVQRHRRQRRPRHKPQ
jgi:hypothetical protein